MRGHSEEQQGSSPEIEAAGLVIKGGETVSDCLIVEGEIKDPDVKRFSDESRYPLGLPKAIPGKAEDSKSYLEMTHGILTECSENASPIINPNQVGYFKNCLTEEYEKRNYKSAKHKPLGHPVEWKKPSHIDPIRDTFGIPNTKGPEVYELLNPPLAVGVQNRSWLPSFPSFTKCGDGVGVLSINRNYNSHFQPKSTFGLEVPCFPEGKACKDVMNNSCINEKTYIIPKELKEFQEKFQHQLGIGLDPNKQTRSHLPPDFSFGSFQKSDTNVAEIFQEYFRNRESNRNILHSIYLKLQEANFLDFDYFLKLCQYHDKAQNGLITAADLKEVLSDLSLELNWSQLKEVITGCHLWSADGKIKYATLVQILNYGKLFNEEKCNVKLENWSASQQSSNNVTKCSEKISDDYESIMQCGRQIPRNEVNHHVDDHNYQFVRSHKADPKIELSSDRAKTKNECWKGRSIPQTNVTRAVSDDFIKSTTSSEVDSKFGKIDTRGWRRFGLQSIRNDLVAPKLKKLSNRRNYGDEMDSYTVLWPSFYTQHGLFLRELTQPCNRDEILRIFSDLGVIFIGDSFYNLWDKAVADSSDGKVTIESFHQLLREVVSSKFFDAL